MHRDFVHTTQMLLVRTANSFESAHTTQIQSGTPVPPSPPPAPAQDQQFLIVLLFTAILLESAHTTRIQCGSWQLRREQYLGSFSWGLKIPIRELPTIPRSLGDLWGLGWSSLGYLSGNSRGILCTLVPKCLCLDGSQLRVPVRSNLGGGG